MTHLHRMFFAVIAAAPLCGCLGSTEAEPIAVAADALEPWQSPISWATPAAPPLEPEPEAAQPPAPPSVPSRPSALPLTAGAMLFARIAACRQAAPGMGAGLANARAMTCLASVLQGAGTP